MVIKAVSTIYDVIIDVRRDISDAQGRLRSLSTDKVYKSGYYGNKPGKNPFLIAEKEALIVSYKEAIEKNNVLLDKLIAHILT